MFCHEADSRPFQYIFRVAKHLLIPKGHKFRLSRQAAQLSFKKHPHLANDLQTTLTLLSEDAFQPKLKIKAVWKVLGRVVAATIYELFSSLSALKIQKLFCFKH